MTATTAFIEDAIKGGWDPETAQREALRVNYRKGQDIEIWDGHNISFEIALHQILLDPLAWQAVAKVRGWDKNDESNQRMYNMTGVGGVMPVAMHGYVKKWQDFIAYLAKGKTIEESLAALT